MELKSKLKKILGKKWTFPALYIIAVVAVLGVMWVYQDSEDYTINPEDIGLQEVNPIEYSQDYYRQKMSQLEGLDSIAVTDSIQVMAWPVNNPSEVYISKMFFDVNAPDEEMEEAIVTFQGELWPHGGIDITAFNNDSFSVYAVLDGKVVRAEKDPVVGYTVELEHDNGLVTRYSSLEDLQVIKGNEIEQGDVLGISSRNIFEKDYGIHLHFEVQKDGTVLNPELFLNQNLSEVLGQLDEDETETTVQ